MSSAPLSSQDNVCVSFLWAPEKPFLSQVILHHEDMITLHSQELLGVLFACEVRAAPQLCIQCSEEFWWRVSLLLLLWQVSLTPTQCSLPTLQSPSPVFVVPCLYPPLTLRLCLRPTWFTGCSRFPVCEMRCSCMPGRLLEGAGDTVGDNCEK